MATGLDKSEGGRHDLYNPIYHLPGGGQAGGRQARNDPGGASDH